MEESQTKPLTDKVIFRDDDVPTDQAQPDPAPADEPAAADGAASSDDSGPETAEDDKTDADGDGADRSEEPATAPEPEGSAPGESEDRPSELEAASGDAVAESADTSDTEPEDKADETADAAAEPDREKDLGTDSGSPVHKIKIIRKALKSIEQNITNIIRLLDEEEGASATNAKDITRSVAPLLHDEELSGVKAVDGRVIEGVFNGKEMVGSDGKSYAVPPNYASKSKLVEGDLLKLTITPKGSFIYKQIGPIERSRVVATLGFDPTNGEYYAATDDRKWNVLKASVTYFKGDPGDEVVVLVPKSAPSRWAAVENIIRQNPLA